MNILLVTPFFTPQTGGVATYLEDLRRFLGQRGHSVVVLRTSDSDAVTRCPDARDEIVFSFYMRDLWVPDAPIKGLVAAIAYGIPTLLKLSRFLREHRIELVCLEYPLPFMWYFYLLRRWTKVKLLIGLHGDDVLSLHLLPWIDRLIVRSVVQQGDWVLAHSSSLLDQAERILGGVKARGSYLPYGVECQRIRRQAASTPQAKILELRPFVLTVAKLYERKGIDILLNAIGQLKQDLKGHRFLIAGDGPEEARLKKMTTDLDIERHVVFLGDVPSGEVPVLFQNCEFFVLPSRSEPFGIVLLEAMTLGKAIVATRVGGIPEFVKEGETGLLVESCDSKALAESILRLLHDHELRSRLGKNGLQCVESRYDYRNLIVRYEELLQNVSSESK